MRAVIISTGDEVRTGSIVDTNSAHIARKLEATGVEVTHHHCVGDDLELMAQLLTTCGRDVQVGVVTGGLGPTSDDLTAAAAANAAGVNLEVNTQALEQVERYFTSRHRILSDANRKQANMPAGARCIENPVGTAPGFELEIGGARFFFLPGVPSEMKPMLEVGILPRIDLLRTGRRQFHGIKVLSTFGLPESVAGERLKDFQSIFPDLKIGYQIRFPEVHIKFYGSSEDETDLQQRLEQAARWARTRTDDHVFTDEGASMATVVGDLLKQHDATLAVAESCTGGLVAHWITEVSGSSEYFLFSGVTYANTAKTDILGVPTDTIERYGAVHEETVKAMARGAQRLSGADYAISTSGIAGPTGGSAQKPVGTVCIGLATPHRVRAERLHYAFGRRSANKLVFAMTALDVLRKELQIQKQF